jgi:hypothetical protein
MPIDVTASGVPPAHDFHHLSCLTLSEQFLQLESALCIVIAKIVIEGTFEELLDFCRIPYSALWQESIASTVPEYASDQKVMTLVPNRCLEPIFQVWTTKFMVENYPESQCRHQIPRLYASKS